MIHAVPTPRAATRPNGECWFRFGTQILKRGQDAHRKIWDPKMGHVRVRMTNMIDHRFFNTNKLA